METITLDFKQAQSSGISPGLRNVYYRVALGVLSSDQSQWTSQLSSSRQRYADLKAKFLSGPDISGVDDVTLHNPLSNSRQSIWSSVFADQELVDTIKLDLKRTHPDHEFFITDSCQQSMLNVLFVWCRLHPDLSYRQGMNELCAILLYIFTIEYRKHPIRVLCDLAHVEDDTFASFERLMILMKPLFDSSSPQSSQPQQQNPALRKFSTVPFTTSSSLSSTASTPRDPLIVRISNFIQNDLLTHIDPALAAHLSNFGIQPTVYLLRWVRVLFSRELSVLPADDDPSDFGPLCPIWDCLILSAKFDETSLPSDDELPISPLQTPKFVLLESFCIALLLVQRRRLLLIDDQSTLLTCLIHFDQNAVASLRQIVTKALQLADPVHRQAIIQALAPPQQQLQQHHHKTTDGSKTSRPRLLNQFSTLTSTLRGAVQSAVTTLRTPLPITAPVSSVIPQLPDTPPMSAAVAPVAPTVIAPTPPTADEFQQGISHVVIALRSELMEWSVIFFLQKKMFSSHLILATSVCFLNVAQHQIALSLCKSLSAPSRISNACFPNQRNPHSHRCLWFHRAHTALSHLRIAPLAHPLNFLMTMKCDLYQSLLRSHHHHPQTLCHHRNPFQSFSRQLNPLNPLHQSSPLLCRMSQRKLMQFHPHSQRIIPFSALSSPLTRTTSLSFPKSRRSEAFLMMTTLMISSSQSNRPKPMTH